MPEKRDMSGVLAFDKGNLKEVVTDEKGVDAKERKSIYFL